MNFPKMTNSHIIIIGRKPSVKSSAKKAVKTADNRLFSQKAAMIFVKNVEITGRILRAIFENMQECKMNCAEKRKRRLTDILI
ncbi:MAG: hypothetical protein ACOYIO_04505 [Eubacteriales bacterium]